MNSIAISGASGTLGRLVVTSLQNITAKPLVLLSRTPETLSNLAGDAVVRPADFDRPDTLPAAMAGVERLVIISTNTLSADGRRVLQHRAAIDAAVAAGVRHIVYTSMLKADSSPLAAMTADHAATEAMLEGGGLSYSVMRHAFYDDLALQILDRADPDGRFPHAAGEGRVAYVTRQQCADAAAVAVSDGFAGRRVLDITGPQAISMAELAALATARRGRRYIAVPVSTGELVRQLTAASLPQEVAAMLAWIDEGISSGAMEPASADFGRLTGREAPALTL